VLPNVQPALLLIAAIGGAAVLPLAAYVAAPFRILCVPKSSGVAPLGLVRKK